MTASPACEVGDLVVLAWTAPCAACVSCRRGEPWLCTSPDGSGHRLDPELVRLHDPSGGPVGVYSGIGTFAERQVVAASAAIKVDPRTPPEIAALIGCAVTTGIGAVRNTANVRPGESVVVLGVGGVGLSAIIGAVAQGAESVTAIDSSRAKLDLATRAGAHRRAARDRSATRPRGSDHVLECIGLIDTVELAIDLVRPGGTVTLVGMTAQGQRASFDVYRFVEDGKAVRGSNYGSADPSRDFPKIATEYLEGRLPLEVLISERIGLEQLDGAFDGHASRRWRATSDHVLMESWDAFARAEPEMAEKGRALLYQRGDGEGFLTTVAANGTPRIHPLNVGVKDGRLLVFIQGHSAKARDLAANPHYALHATRIPRHPRVHGPWRGPPGDRCGRAPGRRRGLVLHCVGRLPAVRATDRAFPARRASQRRRLAAPISVLAERRLLAARVISQPVLDAYDGLVATHPEVERKGATMPYTSMNGHMFTFLTPDGTLALRLSAADREAFVEKYRTQPVKQHGCGHEGVRRGAG